MNDPKASLKLLAFSGALLAMAAAWSAWAGMRLGSVRKQADAEARRLDGVHEALADEAFRAELKDALEAKKQDSEEIRSRLSALAQKNGIILDGSITAVPTLLPNLGMKQVDASFSFKDVPLWRFVDYARTVELEIPDAVVTDVALKPIAGAGDRWEVRMKVSKRLKVQ